MYNEINKSRSSQILGCYTTVEDTFEKGGKRAVDGEVRTWGTEKWVKHSDGWVRVDTKGDKHILERPGGKRESASEEHVEHAKKHLDRHNREVDKNNKKDPSFAIHEHGKEIAEHAGMSHDEYKTLHPDTKTELHSNWIKDEKNKSKKELTGTNPYHRGQSVTYNRDYDFGKKGVETAKVVSVDPRNNNILLDNGHTLNHLELQKREIKN